MAVLTVQDISLAGVTPSYAAAAAAGDTFANDGKTLLHVKNTGTQKTVTVAIPVACSQGQTHTTAVIVPATTGDKMIGPFPPERYNNASGLVSMTYSSETAVTVMVGSL
jgi:hypothetical protein